MFKLFPEDVQLDTSLSEAQAGQDLFVIAMTQGKRNGTFLEIGAGHPRYQSNCYLLEKYFDWSGIGIDKQDYFPNWDPFKWEEERPHTKFYKTDVNNFDFRFVDDYVDYLQIDLDHPSISMEILQKAIQKTRYGVITYEHDVFGKASLYYKSKNFAKKLLEQNGYVLLVNNVTIEPDKGVGPPGEHMFFEDWYVNPETIDSKVIEAYKWVDHGFTPKYYYDILF
jgi:hypothetical protein